MKVEPTSSVSMFVTMTPSEAEDMIIELTKMLREFRRSPTRSATTVRSVAAAYHHPDRPVALGTISLQVAP